MQSSVLRVNAECRQKGKTAPQTGTNVRTGYGPRNLDESGMQLNEQGQGMYGHPPQRARNAEQGYPHQYPQEYQDDEEFEGEYTINDEIHPDDLIKTMGVTEIDKFIPKKPFVHLCKKTPSLEEATCTICLEQLKNGSLLREIPLCKHCFHADCLLSWLQVNEICPNCKNEVSIYTLRAYFDSLKHARKEKKKEESSKFEQGQSNQGGSSEQQPPSPEVIHTRYNPAPRAPPANNRNASRVNIEDRSVNLGDWDEPPNQHLDNSIQANRSFRRNHL